MKRNSIIRPFSALATVAIALLITVGITSGQTAKKKSRHSSNTTAATASQQTQPEIVSRADDYQNDSAIINPQQTPSPVTQTDPDDATRQQLTALKTRVKNLERDKDSEYDQKQKRLALNLEILNRAEQRADSLHKQRYELIDKQGVIRTKLEQIANDLRPEMIERTTAMTGSLRPEEIRDARKRNLEAERRNQEALLAEVQTNLDRLDQSIIKADDLVDRLRAKLEKDIDASLVDDKPDQ
jgi:hypothetical protein